MEQKTSRIVRNTVIAAVVVVIALGAWYGFRAASTPKFCFDFSHDMQFGDRVVEHPVNQGKVAPGGITYYLPEVPALQMALKKQGFYIDPYEMDGGKIYAAAFFGPSTRVAVMGFQKKYGLPQTGQVTNDTIDKLSALYKCPVNTAKSATTTVEFSTTTPKK